MNIWVVNNLKILVIGDMIENYGRTTYFIERLKNIGFDIIIPKFSYHKNLNKKNKIKNFFILRSIVKHYKIKNFLITFPNNGSDYFYSLLFGFRGNIINEFFVSNFEVQIIDHGYKKQNLLTYFLEFYLLNKSILNIFDTNFSYKAYSKMFKIPSKIPHNILPIEINKIFYNNRKVRKISDDEKLTIGYYGSFLKMHGLIKLVHFANYCMNDAFLSQKINFVLIGNGRETNKVKLELKKLNLKNVTLIPKKIQQDLIIDYMKDWHIGVSALQVNLQSLRVIPNKAIEMMSNGLVILSAKTPSMNSLFTDTENILYFKNNEDFGRKIKNLYRSQKLQSISSNSIILYEKLYNDKELKDRYFKLKNQILNLSAK